MHTLLVVSGKRVVSPDLLYDPELGTLSVVTEIGHQDLYGHIERVEAVADINDHASVFSAATRIHDQLPIDSVLAPFETGLPAAAYTRTLLGLPGLGFDTAVAFTNKYVMKRLIQRARLPVAAHALVSSAERAREVAAEIGYPVVLKPVYGGGSAGVLVCESDDDVDRWWRRFDGTVTGALAIVEQKMKILEEFHIDGLVVDGHVSFVAVSRYLEAMLSSTMRRAPYASYQLPTGYGPSDELAELHRKTVEALGLVTGVTHLEVFRTDEGWYVSEIACRAGGGGIVDAIKANHGIDLFDAYLQMSTGRGIPTPEVSTSAPATFFGHTALALQPGKVTRISSADTFASIEGVVGVQINVNVNEVLPDSFLSASSAGFVQVVTESESEIVAALQAAQRLHVLETQAIEDTDRL